MLSVYSQLKLSALSPDVVFLCLCSKHCGPKSDIDTSNK